MIYRETVRPRVSDFDSDGRLSYEAMLSIMEDAASHHSSTAGDNVLEGQRRGISWVLLEWRVELVSRPSDDAPLNIATWVRGKKNSSICTRSMVISKSDGKELIRAEAKLALVDVKAGRFVRIDDELLSPSFTEEKYLFERDLPRMRPLESYDEEHPAALRKSDLDLNRHVHNTRYMSLMLEALDEKARHEEYASLRIAYLKPVIEQNSVTLKCRHAEGEHFIEIAAGETVCTLIQLKK